MKTQLDEYTPSHAPHDAARDGRDDSGRPVDHRSTPGAFGTRDDGFVLATAMVDPEETSFATQTSGAVHHRADVVARPAAEAPPATDETPAAVVEAPKVHEPAPASSDASSPGLLARLEKAVWGSSIVHKLLERLVERQKKSAAHIEDWLEAPGLFRH